jgi:hypothetical protein
MTSKRSRLVVTLSFFVMASVCRYETASAQGSDQARVATAGWIDDAVRWWLGDGRRPPVPVKRTMEESLRHPQPASAGTLDDLFQWWFGDGSRPPHPITPAPA